MGIPKIAPPYCGAEDTEDAPNTLTSKRSESDHLQAVARGGRALAGLHGDLQELRVRELGEARRQAHETGGNVGVGRTRSQAVRGELRQLGAGTVSANSPQHSARELL